MAGCFWRRIWESGGVGQEGEGVLPTAVGLLFVQKLVFSVKLMAIRLPRIFFTKRLVNWLVD
jgi:hypothetical protein